MDSITFANRRRALRDALPDGVILLLGNDESPRNYADNVYPFRQDSHFLYYVGANQPGMAALLVPGAEDVLYGPTEHPDDLVWHGPRPGMADHADAAGISRWASTDTLAADIEALIKGGIAIHYPPPYRAERRFAIADLLGRDPRDIDASASRPLVEAIVQQRSVKSDAEIAEIEEALGVTAEMFHAAAMAMRPGRKEAEVAAALQAAALAHDRQMAFGPIVSVRGEVLHNPHYTNTLNEGDLLVIDAGAESPRWYASDITRAFPVSGRFSSEQREIYEVVLAAQEAAISAAAPGKTNRDLHLLAARTIASGLRDLGLMRGDVDAAVEAGAHALFFPHGLGHMLGQDVHDMEDLGDVVGYASGTQRASQFGLNFLRLARTLEPGFVITVEPGVYFIPALVERWRLENRHTEFIDYDRVMRLLGLGGVRIEDDLLITSDGARVLGPPIPKAVDDVEALLAGR